MSYFMAKCTKFDFGWGSAPNPAGGRGGREGRGRERKRAKKGREGKEGCPGFKSRKGGNPNGRTDNLRTCLAEENTN